MTFSPCFKKICKIFLLLNLLGACVCGAAEVSLKQGNATMQSIPNTLASTTERPSPKAIDDTDLLIVRTDPTILCEPISPQLIASVEDLEEISNVDPGFSKWLLTFQEMPGKAPYIFQMKRSAQNNPKKFRTLQKVQESVGPFRYVVSARGFLPGEKVTFRLVCQDKSLRKEMSFYPRPLVLKKASGEVLLKATLTGNLETTMYNLDVCGVGAEEEFEFISSSGKEKIATLLKGPVFMGYAPAVVGSKGGVSQIELRLKDGASHTLDLPWGWELMDYTTGKK